jgi:medium-chain acyl-[acyl-carrier-protein] hydrolase
MTADPTTSRWLVRPRPNPGAQLRLFCVPFAGAGSTIFRRWPPGLPTTIEVCAVQAPGREGRLLEAPYNRLAPLVATAVEELGPYFTPPFAFFGHSLGAVVAFEIARKLQRQGRPGPSHLIVSGRTAPQFPRRRPSLHDLPEDEFRDELRRLEGTPAAVLENDELMELLLPVLRADFSVSDTYEYSEGPPLDCPITALGGTEDPWVDGDELEGWRAHTRASFTCYQFAGNHFFLHSAEDELLTFLGDLLSPSGWAR